MLRAAFMFPLSQAGLGKAGVQSKLPATISPPTSIPNGFLTKSTETLTALLWVGFELGAGHQ